MNDDELTLAPGNKEKNSWNKIHQNPNQGPEMGNFLCKKVAKWTIWAISSVYAYVNKSARFSSSNDK